MGEIAEAIRELAKSVRYAGEIVASALMVGMDAEEKEQHQQQSAEQAEHERVMRLQRGDDYDTA